MDNMNTNKRREAVNHLAIIRAWTDFWLEHTDLGSDFWTETRIKSIADWAAEAEDILKGGGADA